MHNHDEPTDPEQGGLPYANDEITIPALGKAAVILTVFFLMNVVLASAGYYLFVYRETAAPLRSTSAVVKEFDANVPVLQKEPEVDIHKFRADEYEVERSYAHWKDGDGKTSLRIPVSRAMEIIKQHGLPQAVKKVDTAGAQPAIGLPQISQKRVNGPGATAPNPADGTTKVR